MLAGVVGIVVVVGVVLGLLGGLDRDDHTRASGRDRDTGAATDPSGPTRQDPGSASAFASTTTFRVTSDATSRVSGDSTGCTVPPSLAPLHPGAAVVLYSGGRQLASAPLRYERGDARSCTFSATFPAVPSGLGSYSVEIAHRGTVSATERELREGISVTVQPR